MGNYTAPHYFKKGQSGNPAGRPRGKVFDVAKILEETGCNPFVVLAEIALNSSSDKIRCSAASELAKYVAPTIRSKVESPDDDKKLNITLNLTRDGLEVK